MVQSFGNPRSDQQVNGFDSAELKQDLDGQSAEAAEYHETDGEAAIIGVDSDVAADLRKHDLPDSSQSKSVESDLNGADAALEAPNGYADKESYISTDLSVVRLIEKAGCSAGKLVNLLARNFPSFRDEAHYDGRRVRFLKRAQIFVADLWAAFNGVGYGTFDDIGHLTMFAGMPEPR